MTRKYVIIAGPQASGKSTLVSHLSSKYPDGIYFLGRTNNEPNLLVSSELIPMEESRQVIVNRRQLKGAIFMSYLDEIEVIHTDMIRMFKILRDREDTGELYVDECNVFTLGHAKAHGIDLLDGYFRQYMDLLSSLNTSVLFLNVSPDISWERRQFSYRQRLWDVPLEERAKVLGQYEAYLHQLHPELVAIYDLLPFPKIKIDSSTSLDDVLKRGEEAFEKLLTGYVN